MNSAASAGAATTATSAAAAIAASAVRTTAGAAAVADPPLDAWLDLLHAALQRLLLLLDPLGFMLPALGRSTALEPSIVASVAAVAA